MPTGVLFGFWEQLYSICSSLQFTSNKIALFADSRKSFRLKSFPGYKQKRKDNRTPEEWQQIDIMHEQMNILQYEWLPAMGLTVYRQTGLESDDLIASAAEQLTSIKSRGTMITSDGDLCQCITETVQWYDPQRDILYTPTSFLKKKGIKPELWGMVKAIGGCTTDNVPGVKGVGEKGAIDYLLHKLEPRHKKYQNIVESFESGEMDEWKELVLLPHHKTRPFELIEPDYNAKVFFKFCEKYGIDSYLDEEGREKWELFFEGRFKGIPVRRRRDGKRQRQLI